MERTIELVPIPPLTISPAEVQRHLAELFQQQQIATQSGDIQAQIKERITAYSTIDTQHVVETIRALVAMRSALNESVAVFPCFDEILYQVAHDFAYKRVIEHPDYQARLPDNTPLPELSVLTQAKDTQGLKQRAAEIQKRSRQEKGLRDEVDKLLMNNGITQKGILALYLASVMGSDNNLLGNSIEHFNQYIIPFRKHNEHYTVAVLHYAEQIMNIKYYDSMGNDLDKFLQGQLVAFFKQKGFTVNYQSVSSLDQPNTPHCAIFASLKAIEIASKNVSINEFLIRELNVTSYRDMLEQFRFHIGSLLQEKGFNITLRQDLKEKYAEINTDDVMVEISNKQKKLQVLLNQPEKTPENLAEIQNLIELNSAAQTAKAEIIAGLRPKLPSGLSKILMQLNEWGWKNILLLGVVSVGLAYIGIPYLIGVFILGGALLPSNPLTSIFLMCLAFTAGFEMVNFVGRIFQRALQKRYPVDTQNPGAAANELGEADLHRVISTVDALENESLKQYLNEKSSESGRFVLQSFQQAGATTTVTQESITVPMVEEATTLPQPN